MRLLTLLILVAGCGAPDLERTAAQCTAPVDDAQQYPLTRSFDAPGEIARAAPVAVDGGAPVLRARVELDGGVLVRLDALVADCGGSYLGSVGPVDVPAGAAVDVASPIDLAEFPGAAWLVLVAEPLGPPPLSATVENLRVE
jgi:hypothetical protein